MMRIQSAQARERSGRALLYPGYRGKPRGWEFPRWKAEASFTVRNLQRPTPFRYLEVSQSQYYINMFPDYNMGDSGLQNSGC